MIRLEKLNRVTLVDQVVETIREKIGTGALQPGSLLPGEVEMGRQLGVARTTIREAIRLLMGLGLVVRSEEGLRIAPEISSVIQASLAPLVLVTQEIRTLYEARRVLEGELAALAAARATGDEIAALRSLNEQLAEHMDDREYWRLDTAFHQTVAKCAGNDVLYAMYEVALNLVKKLETDGVWVPDVKASTPERHAAVISAIENREPAKARKAIHRGLREVESVLLRAQLAAQRKTALDVRSANNENMDSGHAAGARRVEGCP